MPYIIPDPNDNNFGDMDTDSDAAGDSDMEEPELVVAPPPAMIRPSTSDVTARIGRALLRGHTMLASHCAACNTVLMRDPATSTEYCVTCSGRNRTDGPVRAAGGHAGAGMVGPQARVIQVTESVQTRPNPAAQNSEVEAILAARRLRRDRISDRISHYLLQGHTMLARHCPLCDTVVLRCV